MRDFDTTDEPPGGTASPSQRPVFVVQEHAASTHHFDLRLEHDGVLLSWAVPKGPSTDPSEQRLAIRTEDHPLGYADFEGHIAEDEYGGGEVVVWDVGPYQHLTTDDDGEPLGVGTALDKGHLRVRLAGQKLAGAYDLVHAKVGGDDANWLLRKVDDDHADARRNPTSTEPESVLSGRTVQEIAEEAGQDERGG